MSDVDAVRRPWCFPCRVEDCRCWAEHLGMACDWHFGILSTADQDALREAVRHRHPRGGRVHNVIEQLVVVRMDLRHGTPNTVEQTWAEESAEFLAMTAPFDPAIFPRSPLTPEQVAQPAEVPGE